jgi:hypothetical protein
MKSNISPNELSWDQFGGILLDTYDLDPLYVILASTSWPEKFMYKWLLGYWIFYSAGVASRLAESKDFYAEAIKGDLEHWPRGHERRHMRGQNIIDTMIELERFGEPEKVVGYMIDGTDFQSIGKRVKAFHGFGPWISWKIADMAERVLQQSVDFSNAEIAVYSDPVKGAALIGFGDQGYNINANEVHQVFDMMEHKMRMHKAPPYQDRFVNIQEIETIACKYKSHCNGHYPPGLDTEDIYHGLDGWGDAAQELKGYLKLYYEALHG